jgi:hypothetical protein
VIPGCLESRTGLQVHYAQEKPEREEHPERAPAGIALPWVGRVLVAEIIFLMFELLQCLQVRSSSADEIIIRLSKFLPQSSQ